MEMELNSRCSHTNFTFALKKTRASSQNIGKVSFRIKWVFRVPFFEMEIHCIVHTCIHTGLVPQGGGKGKIPPNLSLLKQLQILLIQQILFSGAYQKMALESILGNIKIGKARIAD